MRSRQSVLSSLLCLAVVNEIRVSVTCKETFDEISLKMEGGGVCVCPCVCVWGGGLEIERELEQEK